MQIEMYSIKDRAANAFLQPIFTTNEATCLRALRPLVLDPKHNFNISAKDYSLYMVGFFDDFTGLLVPLHEPHFVCNLETFLSSLTVSAPKEDY